MWLQLRSFDESHLVSFGLPRSKVDPKTLRHRCNDCSALELPKDIGLTALVMASDKGANKNKAARCELSKGFESAAD